MKQIYLIFTFLLLLGSGNLWAQVTDVASPICRQSQLKEGRQFLIKSPATNLYLKHDGATMSKTTLSSPSDATDNCIFILEVGENGYYFKWDVSGTTYYLKHPQANLATSSTEKETTTLISITEGSRGGNWFLKYGNYHLMMSSNWGTGGGTSAGEYKADLQLIPVNGDFVDLTYNLSRNGEATGTTTVRWPIGDEHSQEAIMSVYAGWYTIENLPTGTVSAASTFDVNWDYSETCPIVPSSSFNSAYWYTLELNSHYMDKGNDNVINLSASTHDGSNTWQWCFVGDLLNGFKIYNREKGQDYSLAVNSNPGNNAKAVLTAEGTAEKDFNWHIKPSNERSGAGFFLANTTNGYCLNHFDSKLAIWTGGTGAGSTVVADLVSVTAEMEYAVSSNIPCWEYLTYSSIGGEEIIVMNGESLVIPEGEAISLDRLSANQVKGYNLPAFSLSGNPLTITVTYTPIMPEDGKTYRLRAAVSGRYAYTGGKANRPLSTTTDKTTVTDEKALLITLEATGAANTFYMKLVGTGTYLVGREGTSTEPTTTYHLSAHPNINAWVVDPSNQNNLYDDTAQSEVDCSSGNSDDKHAWLFEEVKTKTTGPMAEAAKGYGTFCMDFSAIVPEGVLRYPNTPSDEDGDGLYTMKWNDIEGSMPANTAVLIEGVAGQTYTFYETEREPTAEITDNAMSCTREDGYDYYALAKPEGYDLGFYKYTGTLHTNRGYIRISKEMAANIRGFIFEDGSLTGIEDVNAATEVSPEVYYDLTGRRVTKPTKGIYVVNGKKVIINK